MFVALTTVPLAMVVRRCPESMGIEPEGLGKAVTRGQAKDANPGSATGAVDLSVREALRTSSFWMLLTATVLKMALTVAITVHAVEIAVWKGMDEKTGGFMLALIFFLAIPAWLAVGMVGLRFPFQPLLIVGSVAAGLSLLSLLLLDGNLAVYLFVIFMAVLRGTAPLQWVAMGKFFGRRSFSSLLGILQIFTSVFTLVSPIYAGWVFDTTDSYTLVLVTFMPWVPCSTWPCASPTWPGPRGTPSLAKEESNETTGPIAVGNLQIALGLQVALHLVVDLEPAPLAIAHDEALLPRVEGHSDRQGKAPFWLGGVDPAAGLG